MKPKQENYRKFQNINLLLDCHTFNFELFFSGRAPVHWAINTYFSIFWPWNIPYFFHSHFKCLTHQKGQNYLSNDIELWKNVFLRFLMRVFSAFHSNFVFSFLKIKPSLEYFSKIKAHPKFFQMTPHWLWNLIKLYSFLLI